MITTTLNIWDIMSIAIHQMGAEQQAFYRPMPIFRQALVTSTSSHFESISRLTPSTVAYFRRWIWTSMLLKCLWIISGVCTPEMRLGGILWDGWTLEEEMLSMLDAMTSTRLLMNLGATWWTKISITLGLMSEDGLTADAPWSR